MPNLYSRNVDRAVTFYRDQLGGTQTYRFPAEGEGLAAHVELRLGDVMVAISTYEAVERQGLPTPTAGHPLELVLWCDSVDDEVTKLRAAGTPVLVEPYDHVAGHRRAYVEDPDGNWIALVSNG
jgi:lactoylglutathione lyase